jgi:cytochrome c oxidase assembly factor CtaG
MRSMIDLALEQWGFPWWTAASLILMAGLYLRGFAQLHRQMPARFTLRRMGFYLAGIVALAVALGSPLEALDDRLLITHMLQHLLLLMVAPPLLLLGAPQIPIIRALPPSIAKRTVGVIAKSRACRGSFSFVTHPASAFLLFSTAMLGWHLPGPFESALHSHYRHAAEHACFIVAGTLFWYPIVRPWPAIERWTRLAFLPYLLIADAENSMLAAFLVFSGRVLYPSYANLPRFNQIPAITDQTIAGGIMWLPGSIVFLVPAVVIAMRALEPRTLTKPCGSVPGVGFASSN